MRKFVIGGLGLVLIITLLFYGLNNYIDSQPQAIIRQVFYCYSENKSDCLLEHIDRDLVVNGFIDKTKAEAMMKMENEENGFAKMGMLIGINMIDAMKPACKATLETAISNSLNNEDIQAFVKKTNTFHLDWLLLTKETDIYRLKTEENRAYSNLKIFKHNELIADFNLKKIEGDWVVIGIGNEFLSKMTHSSQ